MPSSPSSHTAQGAFIVARVIAYSWLCRTRGVISTESPEPGYIVVFHRVCPHSRFRYHRHQPRSVPLFSHPHGICRHQTTTTCEKLCHPRGKHQSETRSEDPHTKKLPGGTGTSNTGSGTTTVLPLIHMKAYKYVCSIREVLPR